MPPQQRNLIHESDAFELSSVSSKSIVQKRFQFSLSSNEIYRIPHLDDLSDEEVTATWYAKPDYEKIKMSMIPLIRKMMKSETVEESNRQTIRGLEYRTREGAIRRQHNKVEGISAVLAEQDRQRQVDGKGNDELLSQVYSEVNCHCQVEAHQLALGDVKPAQEYTADALETMKEIMQRRQHQKEEKAREAPPRKSSFDKLIKQMRILRKPAVTVRRTEEAVRSIAGTAA